MKKTILVLAVCLSAAVPVLTQGEPADPVGACCLSTCFDPPDALCVRSTEAVCLALGGGYQGDGVPCVGLTDDVRVFSTSPGAPIPDATAGGVLVPLEVPDEDTCLIGDLDVEMQITHSWIGDLAISVIHPSLLVSTRVWEGGCGDADNLSATADWEGEAVGCGTVSSGPSGAVHYDPTLFAEPSNEIHASPTDEIHALPTSEIHAEPTNEIHSAGTWFLRVEDTYFGDTGTVDHWALHVTCGLPVCDAGGEEDDDDEDDDGTGSAARRFDAVGRRSSGGPSGVDAR